MRWTPDDVFDPYAGAHMHFEELDPDHGTTLATTIVPFGLSMRHAARETERLAEVARVEASAFSARCRHESEGPFGAASVLLLHETVNGVLLTRFTADRRYAGDTLHATRAHAERQIADELGVDVVDWHEIELRAPWAF